MQRPERERKEPTEFNVIVKAKDLVKHTFTITNSTERYPKKYRFTLVNRIQDKAVDIYECVLEANELDLRDAQEYRQRQKLQAKALTYCKELLFFIELSQEMGFISMSSCEYWSKLALEVKYMTTAWKKRVMRWIFFWPSSPPSLARRSRAGMAMARSSMIMDALIYGWIPMAKTVACENAEPDIALYRPRTVPDSCCEK